jgi:HK97 family phage prohead protease
METRQFEFRAQGEGDGRTLSGIVVPYDTRAEIAEHGREFTERIAYGACRDAVASGGAGLPVLWAHDRSQVPVAAVTQLEERREGLYLEARLMTHSLADAVREAVAEGAVRGASIGFSVPEGGDEWRGDQRTINRLQLREISVTPFPAYAATGVGVRASGPGLTYGQREQILRGLALEAAYRSAPPALTSTPDAAPNVHDAAAALGVLTAFIEALDQEGGGPATGPSS